MTKMESQVYDQNVIQMRMRVKRFRNSKSENSVETKESRDLEVMNSEIDSWKGWSKQRGQ